MIHSISANGFREKSYITTMIDNSDYSEEDFKVTTGKNSSSDSTHGDTSLEDTHAIKAEEKRRKKVLTKPKRDDTKGVANTIKKGRMVVIDNGAMTSTSQPTIDIPALIRSKEKHQTATGGGKTPKETGAAAATGVWQLVCDKYAGSHRYWTRLRSFVPLKLLWMNNPSLSYLSSSTRKRKSKDLFCAVHF